MRKFTLFLLLCFTALSAWSQVSFTVLDGSRTNSQTSGVYGLVDGRLDTKWGQVFDENNTYIIMKADHAVVPENYYLITGHDTGTYPGRNWKKWKIYGANFNSDEEATKGSDQWVLVDYKSDITELELPQTSNATADFTCSEGVTTAFLYFKIEVLEVVSLEVGNYNNYVQMAEFNFGSTSEMDAIIFTALLTNTNSGDVNSSSGSSKLFDNKTDTKWGTSTIPAWLVFKANKEFTPFWYTLITANDNSTYLGRNWKSWQIFGANFGSDEEATYESDAWELIDEKNDIGTDILPDDNYIETYHDLSAPPSKSYQYFKLYIKESAGASHMQMSEMQLGTKKSLETLRDKLMKEYADFDLNKPAYQSYLDNYTSTLSAFAGAASVADLYNVMDKIAKAKSDISQSILSYQTYDNIVNNIRTHYERHNCLTGEGRTLIGNYLTTNAGPSSTYPNGTYSYIVENLPLDIEGVAAECRFANAMLEQYANDLTEGAIEVTYTPLEGSEGFSDSENFAALIDGDESTKWCHMHNDGLSYIIFRTNEGPIAPTYYRLFTSNDTGTYPGRNWKTFKIYGANFDTDEDAVRESDAWVLLDDKKDVGPEQIPAANNTAAYLYLSQASDTPFSYFKIEITASAGDDRMQMSDFRFENTANFLLTRGEYYEDFAAYDRQGLVVQQTLLDQYEKNLADLKTAASASDLGVLFNTLTSLQTQIEESAQAYQDFTDIVDEFKSVYLEGLSEFEPAMVPYFTENVEPGDLYSEGSYAYILSTRLLSVAAIREQISLVQGLMKQIDEGGFVVLAGNTSWGDGENWTKLVDGDETTKWGGILPSGGAYVIFRSLAPIQPFYYTLMTGNDTGSYTHRNWGDWKIYGGNFETSTQATRDAEGWVLLDSRENVLHDRLPAANFTKAHFGFSEGVDKAYKYFRVEITRPYQDNEIQMTELSFGTEEDFDQLRFEYVDAANSFDIDVHATTSLIEAYEEAEGVLEESADVEELIANNLELTDLQSKIKASEKVYASYNAAAQDIIGYLEANDLEETEALGILTDYLANDDAPSELYPQGTFRFIYDLHEQNDSVITAEKDFMHGLYAAAVKAGYGVGMDVTALLTNPDFAKGWTGWDGNLTDDQGEPVYGYSYGTNENVRMSAAENVYHRMDISQTLTGLKNGIYEIRMNAGYRPCGDITSTNYAAQLYANDNAVYVQSVIEDMVPVDEAVDGVTARLSGGIEDQPVTSEDGDTIGYVIWGVQGSALAFSNNRYENVTVANVTDGTLTVGIKDPGTAVTDNEWTAFGNARLIYRGELGSEESLKGIENALASDVARAGTLLEWSTSLDGEDYKAKPNYAATEREALTAAIEAAQGNGSAEEKYALVGRFTDIFKTIYETKPAYITLLEADLRVVEKWGGSQALTNTQLTELTDNLTNIEDGLYEGRFSAQEAIQAKTDLFEKYPGYLALDPNHTMSSSITVEEIMGEPFSYNVLMDGGKPYISISGLYENLTEEDNILTFEYTADADIKEGSFYFANDAGLGTSRYITYGGLPATDTWTKVYLDITQAITDWNWGTTSHYLRWYMTDATEGRIQGRHVLVITRAEMEAQGGKPANETGISLTKAEPARTLKSGIYTITGQRVSKPAKGLYIIDGRKVLVK